MSVLISVVVPVYNVSHVLARCLEHLINQTYSNLEIIIIDDGSTDDTPAICQEYAARDARIKIIRQRNAGPANARNAGLDVASGDYVHFHDADDYVELDYYQKMVCSAEKTSADVICGDVDEVGYNFPRFDRIKICTDLYDKVAVTMAHKFNVVWRYIYRRDFLNNNNIRFPDGMFIGEDRIFMWRATYFARVLATAPGATYVCMDNPLSLGKHAGEIMRGRPNGVAIDIQDFDNFMHTSGINDVIQQLSRGQIKYVHRFDFMRLHLWAKKYSSNGDVRYCIFGVPVVFTRTTQCRVRYYFCGLYLFRKYISSE